VPRVRPRPEAQKEKEKELPPAPEEIGWKDTSGIDLTEEELKEKDLFDHFADMGDLKGTKPIMIYFFWPDEDEESEDKKIANQVRRCKLMEENILSSEEVRRASVGFHCFKCNLKELSEELKKKYKLTRAPKILFFDVKGKKAWQLTSTKAKPKRVAKKMVEIALRCKKILEKIKKN
jgi:hypothetical protein